MLTHYEGRFQFRYDYLFLFAISRWIIERLVVGFLAKITVVELRIGLLLLFLFYCSFCGRPAASRTTGLFLALRLKLFEIVWSARGHECLIGYFRASIEHGLVWYRLPAVRAFQH